MYYKLDANDFVTIKKAEKLTCTDYDRIGNFIPAENFISMVDDLLTEIEKIQEKVKVLENDIENNYQLKRIDPYEEYGVSERNFI